MAQMFFLPRRKRKIFKNSSLNAGVSYVEAALSLIVFFVFVFFIIDLSRYFYIFVTLNYAAQQAADYAAKLNVEVPLDPASCEAADIGSSEDCNAYKSRIQTEVINKANSLVRNVIAPSTSTTGSHLISYRHYNPSAYKTIGTDNHQIIQDGLSFDADVGFLRPGERITELNAGQDTTTTVDHPIRGFGECPIGWPCQGEDWLGLMKLYPLAVHIEGVFLPMTPGIGPIRIRTTQFAYRFVGVQALPPFQPVATMANDEGLGGSPTPTPTGGASPSPSPTCCCDQSYIWDTDSCGLSPTPDQYGRGACYPMPLECQSGTGR